MMLKVKHLLASEEKERSVVGKGRKRDFKSVGHILVSDLGGG